MTSKRRDRTPRQRDGLSTCVVIRSFRQSQPQCFSSVLASTDHAAYPRPAQLPFHDQDGAPGPCENFYLAKRTESAEYTMHRRLRERSSSLASDPRSSVSRQIPSECAADSRTVLARPDAAAANSSCLDCFILFRSATLPRCVVQQSNARRTLALANLLYEPSARSARADERTMSRGVVKTDRSPSDRTIFR